MLKPRSPDEIGVPLLQTLFVCVAGETLTLGVYSASGRNGETEVPGKQNGFLLQRSVET